MSVETMIVAVGERFATPGGRFVGVMRVLSFRKEGPMVGKALLADNVYFDEVSWHLARECPWYQVHVAWGERGAVDGDPATLFDPSMDLNFTVGTSLDDAVSLNMLTFAFPELPMLRLDGCSYLPESLGEMIPGLVDRDCRIWDAVSAVRYRVRVVEEALHRGMMGGTASYLALHTLRGPEELTAKFESPVFEHMNRPMSSGDGGIYKYNVPTNWWEKLMNIKRERLEPK